MGSWGPGIFENDHAMDLLSSETRRWATALREGLDAPEASWDDIEGLLLYVRLLAVAGREALPFGLLVDPREAATSRAIATRWRDRFLDLESQVPPPGPHDARFAEHRRARVAVVKKAFRDLLAVAPDDDAPTPPRARSKAASAASARPARPARPATPARGARREG